MAIAGAGLDDPLDKVVPGSAKPLAQGLGLHTVSDLLWHVPHRYLDPGRLTDLGSLHVGEHVSVVLEVERIDRRPNQTRPGYRVEVIAGDHIGRIRLVFFESQKTKKRPWAVLRVGMRALFDGQVAVYNQASELHHPRCNPLPKDAEDSAVADAVDRHVRRVIPVYPLSRGLSTQQVTKSVRTVLDSLGPIPDPVPDEVLRERGLVDLRTALELVHRPEDRTQANRGRARLRFDEAFILQAILAQRRAALRSLPARARTGRDGGLLARFDDRLPYALTAAQRRVGQEIAADLGRGTPMHRLLQGDVGSGKTLVALRAMLSVVDSGGQAVLLAPTEVLAQQHHRTLTALLGPLGQAGLLGGSADGTRVALVTGSQGSRERRAALADVASGEAGIVVGTHALLEESVTYADLGLVVVDEQHRFGVEQRAALASRSPDGVRPHVLVMTATPIPRTVAMTVFGDLDVSVLDERPPGRQPVATHVVVPPEQPRHLARVWTRLREEVALGRKAYVVCPRIGEGEEDGETPEASAELPGGDGSTPLSGVLAVFEHLREGPLAGLRIGVMHGRLPAEEKDAAMRRFALPAGEADALDVLVATTVIEVGVDVPSASTMVVLDADRFGISQLHQLRGRIGRGGDPGLCLLVTSVPAGSPARGRLDAVAATTDGFELARTDVEARREGDVLGEAQSGRRSSLRLLRVVRDEALVADAREVASAIVADDPDLSGHPALQAAVARRLADERAEYLGKD